MASAKSFHPNTAKSRPLSTPITYTINGLLYSWLLRKTVKSFNKRLDNNIPIKQISQNQSLFIHRFHSFETSSTYIHNIKFNHFIMGFTICGQHLKGDNDDPINGIVLYEGIYKDLDQASHLLIKLFIEYERSNASL